MGGKEKCFSFFGRRKNGVGDFSPSSQNISPTPPEKKKRERKEREKVDVNLK